MTTAQLPTASEELADPIRFSEPILGFPHARDYDLETLPDSDGLLYRLAARDEPAASFLTAIPSLLFPDYDPKIPDGVLTTIGDPDGEDLVCLVTLNASDPAVGVTANLLAPILINAETRQAAQIVLNGDYDVRTPVTGL